MTITLDNTTAVTNVILCRLACSRMYFPLKTQLLPETIKSSGYCLCKLKYSSISLILDSFKPLKEKYFNILFTFYLLTQLSSTTNIPLSISQAFSLIQAW